jgi:hypothetical protein
MFAHRLLRWFVTWQWLPSPLETVFLLGLGVLSAVFWRVSYSRLRGRAAAPANQLALAAIRVSGVFLVLWSLCVAFMALQSQVYLALLWSAFGLATAIALLAKGLPCRSARDTLLAHH